jgi:uncharacterized small protein (DUF1192 family)
VQYTLTIRDGFEDEQSSLLKGEKMLKTYRIIPLVFILFLFGFTLITVAPVFAQEQWNPSMGMCHNSRPCIKTNQCGSECAVHVRESKGWMNPSEYQAARDAMAAQSPEQVSTSPSGGEVAQLNARIAELEAENARLLEQQRASADQSGGEVAQLNARIAELEAENARLLAQQSVPADTSGGECYYRYYKNQDVYTIDRCSNNCDQANLIGRIDAPNPVIHACRSTKGQK